MPENVSPSRVYKTQLDAVAYLKDAGYKCSKSQFNRDVKARKVPRTPEGWFDETALLGYANANLTPAGQVADRQLADATTSRLSADAQLKRYQAERARLKLEKEQGLLMPRAEHERDLGARALFFRNEVRNFIHLHGATLIHLVGGDEGRLRELVQWWMETTEIWMDAWSGEREFVVNEEDDGAVALTCGIDVQKRGFWYLVRAWMPTMASYVIDYGYLGSWDDVQALVFDTCYPVQGPDGSDVGERMPIWRACIDSGGTETEGVYTRTEEVYMWVRANGCGVVHACKGASRPQAAPVRWVVRERMPHNGRPIPGGLRLYLIDSGAFKTTDMGRMLNQDSRQPLRFHAGADETLASQLSAERMVRKNGNLVWVREHKDNHLLDCLVLSAAAADASWTPSLPHYILQLQAQARIQSETPRPRAKKRPQPEAAGHRW